MVALRAKYDTLKTNQKASYQINDEANEARVVESASLIEDKDATIAELRIKYVSLKTKHKTLRTSSHGYRTDYETVTAEKKELQQTCRELIKVVESLQKKAAAKCDCRKGIFEQDMRAREEAIEKYRDYMKDLPMPKNLPPYASQLDPICRRTSNLHGYLCQDPNAKSFINHILYLPNRTLEITDLQFLAFGPTHRYDRVTEKWTAGSDLTSLHGGTRELFIEREQFIYYMGTYKCHDLRSLHPTGTRLPANISSHEIHDAALGVPRPKDQQKIVAKCYPDRVIKVEATGLQRVGFNDQLYSSLCQRFATVLGKRKAEKDEKNTRLAKKHKAGGASI
ncbi:hypothetical protein C8R43DRAFT_242434 [Mycena crocata]|nr:hypothetical protein C8R43DRAFT_242434 [Mycena crocata]